MKVSRHLTSRLLLATLLLGATPLVAQGEAPAPEAPVGEAPPPSEAPASEAPATEAPATEAPSAPSGEALFQPTERKEQVPVSKYLDTAEEYLKEMRGSLTKGLDILREARESKDAVRLQCVNDKITAMKGVLRISEDAFISLQEAMATRATEKARYEFSKVRTSHSKMQELAQAAQNCVGTEATVPGKTEVAVEIDPALAAQDPYYGNPDFFFTPEDTIAGPDGDGVGEDEPIETRPPPVSGFQG